MGQGAEARGPGPAGEAGALGHAGARDALAALQNGIKLGGALLLTWGIAIGVRVVLPRHLGPAAFGHLNFADAFAVTAFVLVGLGVDLHLRREYPVRPQVATELFGGLLVARVAITGVLFAAIALVLHATERHPVVWRLVLFFGLAQLCIAVNLTLGAILQARGEVDGLSVVNVVGKVLWGAGVLLGMALGQALIAVPIALLLSEVVKGAVLYRLAHRLAGLRLRLDLPGTRAALVASLPFYVNQIAFTAYGRIDVTVLSFVLDDDRELGWYGAASTLAGLSLLVTPVVGWVLIPLFARAAGRGAEALRATVARSLEVVLAVVVPTALLLALGAEVWIRLVFGAAFAPAAPALRLLAATFVLTYLAMVSACCLNVMDRGWQVTFVSLGGLLVNPTLNVTLVRLAAGPDAAPGAAGSAAALAVLASEALVVTAMTGLLRGFAFDGRAVGFLWRTALASALVVAVDRLAAPLGPARLAVDAVAWVALAVLLGALRWREAAAFVRAARRPAAGPGPPA